MEKKIKHSIGHWVGIGILVILGITAFVTLGAFVVQALWNWLLPELFGLPLITFWQALGLLVLSRLLFGGFGSGARGGRGRHRKGWRRGPLTPEEKERLQHSAHPEESED
ncbi:MAG: hypothetical protein KIS85_03850 [Anaerolineales bacterium]|nr:hypothetical protein [Anaerolineales bacterium]